MSRTRSLLQLRQDVCDRGDITDGGTTGRHTTANLNRRINQAIQQYRRLITDSGCTLFIAQVSGTTSTSATPDTTGWAPRDYIAMPADFYHLEGIDITVGDTTFPMLNFTQLERNAFKMAPSWLANSGVGTPALYKLGGLNQAGLRVAKIIPSCATALPYTVWYLPVPADLVADGDVFDGIAGYEEWVVNRAVMDSLLRDQASQPLYAALAGENAKLESRMAYEFATSSGPGRRGDTRSLRDRLLQIAFGDWRLF